MALDLIILSSWGYIRQENALQFEPDYSTHDSTGLKPWLLVPSLQCLFHRFVCLVDFFVFWFDWGPLGFPLRL